MDNKENRLCPMRSFKPCLLRKCAWYYAQECAIASLGYVDHTLQRFPGLYAPAPPTEDHAEEE